MKVIYKKIKELKPAEYNPRKMTDKEAADLIESIKRFGFAEPIIINEHPDRKNVIVGGHQRVEVAKRLGIDEVPCVFVSLPFEKEQELNLRLNKNLGSWNYDWLANIDEELLQDVGFTSEEMDKIFDLNPPPDIDDVPEVPEEAESKAGEIYQLGRHRLMCGDATKTDDLEKLMDGKKANMVFTDPPYNVDWNYRGKFKERGLKPIFNDNLSKDEWDIFVSGFVKNMVTAMNPGAAYYMCSGWHSLAMFEKHLFLNNAKQRQLIIWAKNHMVMGKQATDYHRQHEQIWYGWKEGAAHHWYGGTKQVDLWQIDKVHNTKMIHSTEKPVDMPIKAIKNSSQRGDIILDLFGGSGSTLIAAEQTNRVCYIMELDPKYCDVIRKRYEILTGDTK